MARRPVPGTFAWWLKRSRKTRYPQRQADAIKDIKRLTGVTISASEFAQWESGSREPRADNPKRQVLYDFFGGTEADDEKPAAPEGTTGVVAAIEAAIEKQTQAIVAAIQARDSTLESLLNELGRYRSSQLDVLRVLREQAPRAVPMPEDEPERDVPDPAPTQSGQR